MTFRTTFDVLRACSVVTGIPVKLLFDDTRFASEMPAKTAVIVVARHHLGKAWDQIGHSVGRDHSSLISAVRRHGKHPETLAIVGRILIQLEQPTWHDRLAAVVAETGGVNVQSV